MNIVSTQLGNSLYNCVRSNLRWPLWTRSHFTYYPTRMGTGKRMNMFNAINNAMDLALEENKSALLFGEDVGFGGVFRSVKQFKQIICILLCFHSTGVQ